MRIVIGIFIILHGLVHLLYFGQSLRLFELESGMNWPDDSWIFSKFLNTVGVRYVAGILCILAAIGFILSGVGLLFVKVWWQPLVIGSVFCPYSSFYYSGTDTDITWITRAATAF